MRALPVVTALVVGLAGASVPTIPAAAATPPAPFAATGKTRSFTLYDGSTVQVGPDGIGWRTDAAGKNPRPFSATGSQASSSLGDQPGPDQRELIKDLSTVPRSGNDPGTVVVALSSGTVDGSPVASPAGHHLRAARTTDPRVNATLHAVGATTAESLFGSVPATRLATLSAAANRRLGPAAIDLSQVYVVHVSGTDPAAAARALRATPGVGYAEPDFYMSTMDTSGTPLPGWVAGTGTAPQATTSPAPAGAAAAGSPAASPSAAGSGTGTLPTNFGLTSSLQSYLNASGVDVSGAYADLTGRYGQIPGQGETITNVSLGDLTDESMAQSGDPYVNYFGPTTVVDSGQRYLDYPSLPLIPTYTVNLNGTVDPLGTVERVDPYLGEVLLDFSVMAPLPHGIQRPGEVGTGPTDLLGIAPGANYRLVEPAQPTFANIITAMVAAAQQSPAPNVITASLGFGTDVTGYAGRYIEDDPVIRSVVAGLVAGGIVVTLSANDGTRLYTPAPVGPDGGATPTDLPTAGQAATSVADDAMSTTPSVVPDSGAIAVGGTTLDDTVAVPPQDGGPLSQTGTFAETRLDGATNFASGFGTRVDVSAPSDNIAALNHACCTASSVVPVLSGGTSASAPMVAAAAADVLQAARLTGNAMDPAAVRALLEQTGRTVATQPQIDRTLHVGPQIDVTRAVEQVLGMPVAGPGASPAPVAPATPTSIVRLSVAHRVAIGNAGATFVEATDPANIDLAGPTDQFGGQTGEALVGPVTIGVDAAGVPRDGPVSYVLTVGSQHFTSTTPSFRLLPADLLAAAGQPLVSTTDRTVTVTVQITRGPRQVLATATQALTFGPTDGTHVMAPAPVVAPVTPVGQPVTVRYDLTGLKATDSLGLPLLKNPELILSSINHWSPFVASRYRVAYSVPLTGDAGTVTIPASAFAGGAGEYGVAVLQNPAAGLVGAIAPLRIGTDTAAARPPAPTLAATGGTAGHTATVTRAAPAFQLTWDASAVAGATGAVLEISAPGPSVYGLYNTFTNQFGGGRDDNGVDTASSYFAALPGLSGSQTVDATTLGLSSSLTYAVRVLATGAGGNPIGQASPSSALVYNDGLAPGGATVDDFSISAGGASAVATSTLDASGRPVSSSIYSYTPATATYGPTYAQDNSGYGGYFLYGGDPASQRLLAAEYPWSASTQHLLTYDTATRAQVADVPVDLSQYNIFGGRVDPQRGRTALLAWAGDGTDVVVPVDTATGTLGTAVVADNGSPRRFYRMMDIDESTGNVDLVGSLIGDLCVIRASGYTTVNLDAGTATPMTRLNRCDTGVASDQAGNAEVTIGPLYSYPMLPAARYQRVDESTTAVGPVEALGGRSPIWPVVDPVHHLLVVGFLAGPDYLVNNDAMSAVGTYNLDTGAQVSFNERFSLIQTALNGLGANMGVITSERGIQLDPATRTAWTYGPDGAQVQQFSY